MQADLGGAGAAGERRALMDITGASAIVTGGASGLGEATARLLAQRGAKIVVLDLQEEKGAKVAAEVGGVFVKADVADEEQVRAAVEAASELGPLRVLVNSAGLGRAARIIGRDLEPIPLETFEFVIRVNLVGTYNCARLAASAMARTEPLADGTSRGAILNTASAAAFDGQIGQTPYSASKGGVVGLTLPMARDLARHGIRVNTIAPGLIDTPIYGEGERAEAFKAALGQSVVYPNRLGKAEEYASMAVEVLTNDYMNGETIRLDGAIRMPPKS
jgi:NAD(P)-dependent dehydrogenase (short-subunit alcohol dehydrogenase family)